MNLINWQQYQEKYRDQPVWLVCGGPSVRGFDFSQLNGTVAAINEIGRDIPNLDIWIGNDTLPEYPAEFWIRDCLKLIRREQGTLPNTAIENIHTFASSQQSIGTGPNLIKERLMFDPDKVLWGAPGYKLDEHGKRVATIKKSAMLMAFGVLWRLGFKEVRLIGCDWQASLENAYGHAHKQVEQRDIERSTLQFRIMEDWYAHLLPMFQARGFNVLNCTDGGHLEVFERRDWRELIPPHAAAGRR